jgi:hypothetical protein
MDAEESLGCSLAGEEATVPLVDVGGEQGGRERIGARDKDGRHVGCQPSGDERSLELLGGHEHLAAQVTALLLGCELVLQVHARGTRFDHRAHQLEGVQVSAEPRLGVGDDRRQPLAVCLAGRPRDLVRPSQRVVDPADHGGHRVGRIERLVRVGVAREVRVRGDLPAGEVDRLQARFHAFDGLPAGQAPERGHMIFAVQQIPEQLRPPPGQGVLLAERASETDHLLRGVGPHDPRPAGVPRPSPLHLACFFRDPSSKVVHRSLLAGNRCLEKETTSHREVDRRAPRSGGRRAARSRVLGGES